MNQPPKPQERKIYHAHEMDKGALTQVEVCAVKRSDATHTPLGGYFRYAKHAAMDDVTAPDMMVHCSAFPFPADGRTHVYEFPEEFVARLEKQAAEIPEVIEVHRLPAKAEAPAPVAPHKK